MISDGVLTVFTILIIAFLSPDGAFDNSNTNTEDVHVCRRQCRFGETPKLCEYVFNVEWYTTMSRACFYCPSKISDCSRKGCIPASGTQRPIITANRRLPGPSIEVCKGDHIRVKVYNEMQNGETISIHWHGIRQRNSQNMDGVPMITQCPILPNTMFTYEFEADLPGTYSWHSQTGVQRADGLAGALIIRDPNDPHVSLYDADDLPAVILQDWFPNEPASYRFVTNNYGDADNKPPQILINGLWQSSTNSQTSSETQQIIQPFPVPVSAFEYKLNSKLRYRFRVISNAFMLCPISVTIEGHGLVLLATDGHSVKPQATRSLVIMPGERYDFVPYLTGEYLSRDAVYWLTATGLSDCAVNSAQGLAKISYLYGTNPSTKSVEEATNNKTSSIVDEINSINAKTNWDMTSNDSGQMNVVLLDSLENDDPTIIRKKPDMSLIVEMNFDPLNNKKLYPWIGVRGQYVYSPRFNHITNRMPPAPLLTQPDDIPRELFCNSTNRKCSADEFCECVHVLNVPVNSLVEIVLINAGNIFPTDNHPIHLHGYAFRLVGMDKLHENFAINDFFQAEINGNVRRKFANAVLKDTVSVPAGGYAIIRFIADNPGAWLLHCHVDFYMEMGMALVVRVGSVDPFSLPLRDFPYCGKWAVTPQPSTILPPQFVKSGQSRLVKWPTAIISTIELTVIILTAYLNFILL